MKQNRIRIPKRGTPSATTQKSIDHLPRLADPDRRDDPEVETTMLLMMRVRSLILSCASRRTLKRWASCFVTFRLDDIWHRLDGIWFTAQSISILLIICGF